MTDADDAGFEVLEPLLSGLDPSAVHSFFAGLDESARRSLAPSVRRWVKDDAQRMRSVFDGSLWGDPSISPEERTRLMDEHLANRLRSSDCQDSALLATATLAELRKRGRSDRVGLREGTVQVLVDRRPDWCADFVDDLLALGDEGPITWEPVCRLVDEQLIEVPAAPGLVDLVVRTRVGQPWGRWRDPIIDRLRNRWDLCEGVIWRIFATPVPSLDGEEWRAAIIAQTETGAMPRGEVIDEVLAALRRDDFRPKQLKWLLGLLADLQPSDAELAEREQAITDLLTTDLPAIAAVAISYLDRVGPSNLADRTAVLRGLSSSVLSKTKATAKASLDLTERLLAAEPSSADDALRVGLAGMGHRDGAIRRRSVGLTARLLDDGAVDADAIARELESALAALPAAEVEDAGIRFRVAPEPEVAGERDDDLVDHDTMASLPSAARVRWGVDNALEAIASDSIPAPLRLVSRCLDGSALGELVVTIDGIQELADVIGHALAHGDDWLAAERCLDGLSRLGPDLPSLGAQYDALLRQAQRVITSWPSPPPLSLAQVVVRAGRVDDRRGTTQVQNASGLGELNRARAQEIGHRLHEGVTGPLLSVPSHTGGWISPEALVDRIEAWPATVPVTDCDAVCALLRLHGLDADGARSRIERLAPTRPAFVAVAHALGMEVDWSEGAEHLRIAAEDARARLTNDAWPDQLVARAVERLDRPRRAASPTFTKVEGSIFAEPAPVPAVPVELPDVVPFVLNIERWADDHRRWARSVAPGYGELMSVPSVIAAVRYGERPSIVDLQPLLEPDMSFGSFSRQLEVIALASDDPTTRIVARDVLIAVIEDGRLDVDELGETVAHAIDAEQAKTNRLVEELGAVSIVSDLHGDEVARLVDHVVGHLTDPPTGANKLLELANDLHVLQGRAVTNDATRATLERWATGSSQRAKVARQMLAADNEPNARRRHAALLRLNARIERAQRWQPDLAVIPVE